ncbi:MAG: hypothetical protein ABSB81_01410 [Halobacteriota archaeon]|jgi:ribose/xylose/arabinose/galactoside ABC-type transport system permease subunit
MDVNKALAAGSAAGLVLFNLAAFSAQTAIAAGALAVVTILYLRGFRFQDFELFIFILAELSPISLHASLVTALTYQALSIALLVALCAPLSRSALATHRNVVPVALALALMPPFLFALTLYAGVLRYSANRVLSLATLALLAVVGGMLILSQRDLSQSDQGSSDSVES